MFASIVKIAVLCIVIGGASIPVSFTISSSPTVVWAGNSLGSALSAIFVIVVAERITHDKFRAKVQKFRIGNKVVKVMDGGSENKQTAKARGFINKHGLRLFALVCPIFPGVLVSTATVYALGLDKRTFKIWLIPGVVLVSGFYVFSYWLAFVK